MLTCHLFVCCEVLLEFLASTLSSICKPGGFSALNFWLLICHGPKGWIQRFFCFWFPSLPLLFWCPLQGWPKFWQGKELPDLGHVSSSCVSCFSFFFFFLCVKRSTSWTPCVHSTVWLQQSSHARPVNAQKAKEEIKGVPVSQKNEKVSLGFTAFRKDSQDLMSRVCHVMCTLKPHNKWNYFK